MLPCGFNLYYFLGRQTNDIGTYDNITGRSPQDGAQVGRWNGAGFDTYTYSNGGWMPTNPPALGVGVSARFFIPETPSYTINIQHGYNLIANQLDHGSNTLNECLVVNQLDHGSNTVDIAIPDGSALYKYDNRSNSWVISTYSAASGKWSGGDSITLSPGEGAFFQSPTNFTLAFTGHPHVPVLPISNLANSVSLLSRQTNDIGNYNSIVGLAPTNGVRIYQWNGSGYNPFYFSGSAWIPAEPTATVGESLWISPTGAPPPLPPSAYAVNIHPGFNLIANQLDHGSNTLNECLIANQLDHGSNTLNVAIPNGSVLYKYDNGSNSWLVSTYSAAANRWSGGDTITLSPGEGAILQSPASFTLTFTGTPHVPVLPLSLNNSIYLLSRQTNDLATYDDIVGLPPNDGAVLYQWNGSNYNTFTFSSGTWSPSTPTAAIGEAVWIALVASHRLMSEFLRCTRSTSTPA